MLKHIKNLTMYDFKNIYSKRNIIFLWMHIYGFSLNIVFTLYIEYLS